MVETVPLVGVRETLEVKPLPESVETLKPVGAVTTKFAERYIPETVKLWLVLWLP